MLTQDKVDAFLEDLKGVYEKHQLIINGCGCCGSPFIEELVQPELSFTAAVGSSGQIANIEYKPGNFIVVE